ncbi:MAG: MBOAT family O-acyltransferase, partial [Planctomycetota bacterium]
MLFSSAIFVFLFLPIVLAVYYALLRAPITLRNSWLLLVSLFFYAWGEKIVASIMLVSILANYGFGLWVARARDQGRGKGVIVVATVFNIGMLVAFKYADWLRDTLNAVLLWANVIETALPRPGSVFSGSSHWSSVFLTREGAIRLPIGISFFTFQAFSYVIDVYRRDGRVQQNPINFALYVALFPQLIAGPIVRYCDVDDQITERHHGRARFAYGIRRFIIGLAKKMLIANIVAKAADGVFGIPGAELTPALAWLGIVCYSLQIYFDFSAYSD